MSATLVKIVSKIQPYANNKSRMVKTILLGLIKTQAVSKCYQQTNECILHSVWLQLMVDFDIMSWKPNQFLHYNLYGMSYKLIDILLKKYKTI